MQKYGFVYIWRDRKHNRYYVGAHWGTIEDGYVCSSTWMKNAYRRRPEDFKRRILGRFDKKESMFAEEKRLFSLIEDRELGVRYYNLNIYNTNHWSSDPKRKKSFSESQSDAQKKRFAENPELPEQRVKRMKALVAYSHNKTPEHIEKIRKATAGLKRSDKFKEARRQSQLGKKHSKETKAKIRQAHLDRKK